jgi:hypothetical protein
MSKLTDLEYDALADEYAREAPALSGDSGYLTRLRERALVNELLGPDFSRIVSAEANARSTSPAEIIRTAIRNQLVATL